MTSSESAPVSPSARRRLLGLPFVVILGLALLASVRVVLHDTGVIREGTFLNLLAVLLPLAVWVLVAVRWSSRPLLSLLVTGGAYGVLLAAGHNILWRVAWGDEPPRLGGAFEGRLAPWAEELLLRGATSLSSLVTGVAVGLVCGLLAWGIRSLLRPS